MRRGSGAVDLVLVLAFGVSIGLAAATVIDQLAESDDRIWTAQAQTTHVAPRVVTNADVPFVLHDLEYVAHGGLARIEWYDGAWSPLAADSGCYVTLLIDGRKVASTLFGGRTGRNEARAGSLVWTGVLPSGRRQLRIQVDRADRGFAIPDASPSEPAVDGMLVTEWAR